MGRSSLPPVDAGLAFSKAATGRAPEGLMAGNALRQVAREDNDDRRLHDRFHAHSFAVLGAEDDNREREINKMLVVPPPPEFMRTRKVELSNDSDAGERTHTNQRRTQTMALRMGGGMM